MYNRLSSYISQGVYTFSGPFHPFGGAVDIVVVEQQDGTFKSTPWYVKFGKFQGVLKRREKIVLVGVNDVEAKFHMHLDHKGEAYLLEDLDDDDDKQPFSPPSGPSSGDEAHETLAIEYGKTEPENHPDENDSSGEDESGHDESMELQFPTDDACSESVVSRETSQEKSKLSELLNEAVGVKDEKESTPAAALLANSALISLQKVAEVSNQDAGEVELEVAAETTVAEASSVYDSDGNEKHAGSKNGEYAYEVSRVVDNRFVIKGNESQEVQLEIGEVEQVSGSGMEKQEEVRNSGREVLKEEKAWTEVITKAAAALQEEPAPKPSETSNVERRTWGWWVWRSGSTNKPRLESQGSKLEKNNGKERVEKLKTKGSAGDAESSADESFTETSETGPAIKSQRSRSMLGVMFGAGRVQGQSNVQIQEATAENVVELLDSKWTVGGGRKSKRQSSPETVVEDQQETSQNSEEFDSGSESGELKKESSVTSNVDLVLMSVDGHVVVAKQDGPSPRQGCISAAGAADGRKESFQAAVRSAPIGVPGKRILEPDGEELKVGSESTLDTSPHRTDVGRLSSSLSSYFVSKDGKSSAAVDESVSSNVASQFPSAGTDTEEGLDKASMDVQVGSPWSTVSIPATISMEESDSVKTEEPEKPEEAKAEEAKVEDAEVDMSKRAGFELSLCRNLLREGMGIEAAGKVFDEHKLTLNAFKRTACLMGNEELVVRVGGKYYPSGVAASILFGLLAFGQLIPPKEGQPIKVEAPEPKDLIVRPRTDIRPASGGGWRLWPFGYGRAKSSDPKNMSNEALLVATEAALHNSIAAGFLRNGYYTRSWKSKRTLLPTSDQLASLNLKPGKNIITFTFTTRVLGRQQVDARIYLWKWNTKIVVSDVDGTITRSDVLGQVMPLVGRDWSQTGVTRLFSAIKENGYELMFLSARAISQAYLTRQFLLNLIQDGEPLPDGPVVISPDGLFPSLYREVIRRAPHEFKISCLEDIKALFPADCQPFYAGFGNRDTDEISYLKVGIPKGKIFIINPKGEVIVNNILDMKSYTSLHKLVNDMFPPVNLSEREDFNSWNYWKMPLPDVDDF